MTRRLVIVEDIAGHEHAAELLRNGEVRCDRCKHWNSERASGADEHGGTCALITVLGGGARIVDADEDAWVETQAAFGCASFSPLAGAEGEK